MHKSEGNSWARKQKPKALTWLTKWWYLELTLCPCLQIDSRYIRPQVPVKFCIPLYLLPYHSSFGLIKNQQNFGVSVSEEWTSKCSAICQKLPQSYKEITQQWIKNLREKPLTRTTKEEKNKWHGELIITPAVCHGNGETDTRCC